MALTPRRFTFGRRLCVLIGLWAGLGTPLLPGSPPGPGLARAEDPAERAAEIRDEILAKRRAQSEHSRQLEDEVEGRNSGLQPRIGSEPTGPAGAALVREEDQARARLDAIVADLDAAAARQDKAKAQHQKIAAELAGLDSARERLQAARRLRVAAIYRAADLGSGAAGWQAGLSAKSVRLARYLVASASRGDKGSAALEVQRGSNLAALDDAALEEETAGAERRRLEGLREVAENEVARAESRVAEVTASGPPPHGRDEGLARLDAAAREIERKKLGAAGGELEKGAAGGEPEMGAAGGEPEMEGAGSEPHLPDLTDRRGEPPGKPWSAAIAALMESDPAAKAGARPSPNGGAEGSQAGPGTAPVLPPGASAFDWSAPGSEPEPAPAAAGAPTGAAPLAALPEAAEAPNAAAPAAAAPKAEAAAPADAAPAATAQSPKARDDAEAARFVAAKGGLPAPVSGRVVANFGQVHESGATYRGLIVRAARGSEVRSIADGTVLFSGALAGLGNTLIVSHGGRYHTVYARLETLRLKVGQHVQAGEVIGVLPAGDGDLHFEMRDGGTAIDPRPWLGGDGPDLSR